MSAIRKARRERQAAHIDPDFVTSSENGNVFHNPKVWEEIDGEYRRKTD